MRDLTYLATIKSFDSADDLIAELKKPDAIDNPGPETATEPSKLAPITPERLLRLERIAATATLFCDAFSNETVRLYCAVRTQEAYARFCNALDAKENDMTRRQIEVAAREAEDEATERREQLDQREADLSGKIEDCDQQIIDLNNQLDAATELVSMVQNERDASKRTLASAESRSLHWMRLHDAVEKDLADLKLRRDAQECTRLQRENAKVAEKLERWDKVEREGMTHIEAALDNIGKFIDVIATSPRNE